MDRTILIVDSDNDLAGTLSAILSAAGYRVRSFASEEAALYAIFQAPPALVVIDVAFRDGDGVRFTQVLRRQGSTFPVVAVYRAGGDSAEPGLYSVPKPVNPVVLLRTVATALATWESDTANRLRA